MFLELNPDTEKILISVALVLFVYLIMLAIIRIVNRRMSDLKRRHSTRKATLYIATLLALVIISIIWIENLRTVSVVISVIGAGLVVALGDMFLSIGGWFLILFKRPFETGDRIEMDGVKGDVIDIRLFQTSLLEIGNWVKEDQSTGRVVHISNGALFKKPLFNFTRGFEFLWDEIKVTVTFESNWKKAQDIMLRHAQIEAEKTSKEVAKRINKMAEEYLIFYEKLTPITYVKIVENGVEISLRYLTEVKRRRECQNCLNRLILDDFEKERDIAFAYPTYRLVK
ncbi:MAG: mechanosensitive ion channel family protein [Candidatus Omnitrophica bacterium]|nr:mechanosensitive ion channel family protein [Candidatus Omnitrophota bacterium]